MSGDSHQEAPAGALRLGLALGAADIVGVWDGDLVHGVIYGDSNFARIYGVDPAMAARGVPRGFYLNHIHPDDVPAVRAAMDSLFAGAAEYVNEHRILRSDGSVAWVHTRGRLVLDAEQHPIHFAGVSVDITARRNAESRQSFLLKLADRLSGLTESKDIVHQAVSMLGEHVRASRVGFGQVHADGLEVTLETGYADGVPPLVGNLSLRIFGEHNLLLHQQGRTIVYDDTHADPRNASNALGTGEIRSVVSVPLLRAGRLRATLFVSCREPRTWEAEDIRMIENVASRLWDSLERARAEEALRQVNASLEKEIDARERERQRIWGLAPLLMVEADAAGNLLQVNPTWTQLLGWTAQETLGRNVMDFVAPEDREVGIAGMQQLFAGNSVIEYQNTFISKTQARRRIAWTTVPEGGRLYGYGRDVTEQLAAEERVRQSQKMEAVGQLTGGLAHDFNNLLMGISGSLELLQTRVSKGQFDDLGRYLESAQSNARRAAALTHRMLAFSRRQTLDPKAISINALIVGMQDLVQRTLGPALHLNVVADPALWTTLVDANQLENALLNLAINARDAMPDGGVLSIATANRELDPEHARSIDLLPGNYVELSVTDTGVGMPPEVVSRAFDPFFTTKPLGAGTGLGLSMIYGFARQSGGQSVIRSTVGYGTTVSIFLPRHMGSQTVESTANQPAPAPRAANGETVLVVDDEPTVQKLVLEVLEELGYATIAAASGEAGLRVLRSAARVDLLVTDVGLPGGLNGRQLADAGREIRSNLKVLFITGYAATAAMTPGTLQPGMQVLTKPFDLRVLAFRVQQLMQPSCANREQPDTLKGHA